MPKTSLLLLFLFFTRVYGQTPDSMIDADAKVWANHYNKPSTTLFVSLDKQLYSPGENLLFTTFLLGRTDSNNYHAFHILLVDLSQKKTVASDRFVMKDGLSTGSLYLPDSLTSGEYLLTAYTSGLLHGFEERPFRQQINIRTNSKSPFQLISSPILPKGDSLELRYRVTTDYGGLASGAVFQYGLGADGRILQSGSRIINSFGEVILRIPSRDTLATSVILNATVTRGQVYAHFWTPLILTPNQVMIHYYPEGGNLVDRHSSRIGIAIERKGGKAIQTTGTLYEDTFAIRQFNTDQYGFGVVDCVLQAGKKYHVEMENQPPGTYLCGEFPPILKEGMSLSVDQSGIVRDSMTLVLQNTSPRKKCIIMVYSDQAILYTAQIGLRSDYGRLIVNTSRWPRGIARVVLFTEDNQPVAERTIFLPWPKLKVSIHTDSLIYHTRSKVLVDIKITNEQGDPVSGVFSFASTLSDRLHPSQLSDITEKLNFECYLHDENSAIPPASYFEQDSAIDLALLTRFGPEWNDLVSDTGKMPVCPPFEDFGYVLHNDKKLKKPAPLLLLGPSTQKLVTDSSGKFILPFNALLAPLGINPVLSVIGASNPQDYKIVIQNSYDSVNQRLVASWYTPAILKPDTTIIEDDLNSTAFNTVKTLKNVVVRAGDTGDGDYKDGAGACRDWVCMNNVLNCANHPFGSKPRIGATYYYVDKSQGPFSHTGNTIVYKGCVSCGGCTADSSLFIGTVRGIHLSKDFYNADSIRFSPTEPAIYTTLYWSPLLITDKNGEAHLYFYTNDLKGRFYNVVQGISRKGIFSGKEIFRVTP